MAHLVASDAHSPKVRGPSLKGAFDVVKKRLGSWEAEEIFFRRPAAILAGEDIVVPEAAAPARRGFFKWWGLSRRGYRNA
jgi:tyrosine-protein phosphatase YwqE